MMKTKSDGKSGFADGPNKGHYISRFLLSLVEKKLGKPLVAQRILLWYPKAFWGSGMLEALVAHDEKEVPRRLLALIRLLVSFRVSCAFCIDMNAKDFAKIGISDGEIEGLKNADDWKNIPTISDREKAALDYVEGACRTPVSYTEAVVEAVLKHFSEKGLVIIASTAAQVNFWARLIQGLGAPPAGFSEKCAILDLEKARLRVSEPK